LSVSEYAVRQTQTIGLKSSIDQRFTSMQKKKPSKPSKTGPRHPHEAPRLQQQVRIIGGLWKRTPLPVLPVQGLRPTPDRVRETVFNWLTHLIDARWEGLSCLDLFAGTGALGFEAASRGADKVLMVEAHTPAVRQLEATRTKLHATDIEIVRGDALAIAQSLLKQEGAGQFDLIFLDPPYHEAWLPKMLPHCRQLLKGTGYLYVESEMAMEETSADAAWREEWEIARSDRAGIVFYHVLKPLLQ
jgi:16S rRNA (guanine966-N2)-methyltransferase